MTETALMSDENNFAGRVRRYARVGSAMGGLAARLAGERYLGIQVDRGRHAADLKAALGGIKGPLMKVAQLLATIPDALPEEYVRELVQLQANAPAMGWPFVRRRMMGELGADWQSRFESFEQRGGARRLARARCTAPPRSTATALACKLQYPDMASAVEADLRQLRWRWASTSATTARSRPPKSMPRSPTGCARSSITSARPRICGSMAKSSRTSPGRGARRLIPELSTGRLLTMTWLEGGPILDIAKAPLKERNEIALRMFRIWYVPFYYLRRHPRRPASRQLHGGAGHDTVNLLDFGCVRIFPRRVSSRASSTSIMRSSATTSDLAVAGVSKAGASAICRRR